MLLTLARLITVSLLIASAAAFATGATIERHTASSESQPAQHQHAEAGKPGENPTGAEPAAGRENTTTHTAEQNSETLLGINPGGDRARRGRGRAVAAPGRADPH